ncbi:MAG TPA: efflux RND transporter periplasmic adaptor subunit [Phycisphaerae bacterium]|nr:efflux RND transporter periplasmic adaptor subunit [Phycisphaerales bacterium]HRX83539.1 efflux RND transporter periplasmic adaptor subunit [Phycisphaerae bacterium]
MKRAAGVHQVRVPIPSRSWRAGHVLLLSVLTALVGCRPKKNPAPPPPTVTVAHPLAREVVDWDEYTGRLQAVDSVDVRARVSGEITAVPFEEGGFVEPGDLLVQIDARPYQAELDSRIAEQARAQAQVELAAIELKRIENIPEDASTPNELETAQANMAEAKAQFAAAEAAVAAARLNVEWCTVTAPIGGRTSQKYETVGNLITGGGEQGTLLTTITSIDPIYCYIDADERSVLKYQRLAEEGKRVSARDAAIPCYLQLIDETGFPHTGYIDFVDNRMDPTTGTIRARGVFPNPDGFLTPGFFGRLRVSAQGTQNMLLVPDAAVATDQNRKLLLVVGPDNKVAPREVTLGPLFGKLRAIASGITVDDRVVTKGLMQARPGATVKPQEETLSVDAQTLTAPGGETTPMTSTNGEAAD